VPGFCGNCGSPIAPGVRFCSKCGAAVPGAAAEPAIAATPAPAPAPPLAAGAPISPTPAASQGSSSVLKIILIVVAVFVFLMLLIGGGCFYVAYRVKQKAHEFSQQMSTDATPYTGKRDPCLLSSSEVGAILREPVEARESRGTSACEYRYGSGGNRRLDVEFTWKGGAMAMKFAHGAMQHISGMETFTPVPDIGDEAYLAPGGSGFMMRKGDVLVNIDLRATGISADAAEKIAAKIADRL
jgi:zinc-ribbon domain